MSTTSANKDPAPHQESFPELLGKLAKSSAVVIHDEIQLGIQRFNEMVKAARSGVLLIMTGAVIGIAAFMSLCAAFIMGLSSYMSSVIAALITGVALALVSVVIAFIGYRQLKM